jgi:glutathione synthase/RimK-type ligase-like ATP-grasp enzyme
LTEEALDNLGVAPVTLQEEIGGIDVRVFVCGRRVMACQLTTDEIDFRDDPDPYTEPVDLPDEMADRALRIARELDLVWTGMDFRLTPDGRYVFLEANPSPMFLGFEARTGLPLAHSLADLLMEPG